MENCKSDNPDLHKVLLRVDGEWVFYTGSTSMRKLYYRAHEMVHFGRSSFYIHEYGYNKVDAAIFPDRFWTSISCCAISGVDSHNLPTRLFANVKNCSKIKLGNGCGRICTFCGDKS